MSLTESELKNHGLEVKSIFFFFFFFFKLKCNFILQLQHLHYLHYYHTNIYSYNMLANYTTYIYNTYTRGTLLILTLLIHEVHYLYMHYFTIRDDLRKYETTYNTILMLLRNDTNTAVQLQIDIIKRLIA